MDGSAISNPQCQPKQINEIVYFGQRPIGVLMQGFVGVRMKN
jgi:hypothetical protein